MLLTRRTLALLLIATLLLAGGTFATVLLYLAVIYLFVVLAMLIMDWRLTPPFESFELVRLHDQRLSLGAENLIRVRVRNNSRRSLRILVRDEYPASFRADRSVLGQAAVAVAGPIEVESGKKHENGARPAPVAPRQTVDFRYHVRPARRGDYRFGDLNLRWWGVLGLTIRQARYAASADVKVYPNLLDVRKYELLVRRAKLTEMGLRQTRQLGAGTQFERLREYQPDDEFRKIDWKATARRGKPISREFESERSQNIMALLDLGRLMRSRVGDMAKLDYAVNAALMLSFVASTRGDRAGLMTFADGVKHYLAPRSGRGQFYRMLAMLYAVESQPVEADYARALAYFGAKQKKRSLVVIFTDLASGPSAKSLFAQVARLRPRHLPLLVAISDPDVVELAKQYPRDSAGVYQRMIAEQTLDQRAIVLGSFRQHGVLTLDVPANQLTIAVVNRYLELKLRGTI